ncbi:MAG: hypothetical protein CMG23_08255, partial [Candidatus Marinimicrobia bacterium]|nr:hypothetical protein [Candidatus Neomarinimicrobiota bacterium]
MFLLNRRVILSILFSLVISFLMAKSFTRDQSFQFIHGNTELNSSIDSIITFNGTIYNISNEVITLTILRTINDLPQSWNSSICVGMTCYSFSTDSIAIEISAGDSMECGLSIQINERGSGSIQINLYNIDDLSQ